LPGIYTENLTLKAGVNLTAQNGDSNTPNVTIIGKCSYSSAGSLTISNIRLKTNADYCLEVSGSSASGVNLINCYIICSDHTGINYSSSGNIGIGLNFCYGDITTTGISLFTATGVGGLNSLYCQWGNSGGSTTPSTTSATGIGMTNCLTGVPLSATSTGSLALDHTIISTNTTNTTSITTAGSGRSNAFECTINSGTASAISVGSGTFFDCHSNLIISTNNNIITGAGTLNYDNISIYYISQPNAINVTTQNGGTIWGGRFQEPSPGFLGEQIRSFVSSGSAVSLVNSTGKTVTSISLTAGVWDISALVGFVLGATTIPTQMQISISPTDNSQQNLYADSDNVINLQSGGSLGTGFQPVLTVPSYRVTLATTTIYYIVALCVFSISTAKAYGRISATRVG